MDYLLIAMVARFNVLKTIGPLHPKNQSHNQTFLACVETYDVGIMF